MRTDSLVRTGERVFLIYYLDDTVDMCNLTSLRNYIVSANGYKKIEHFWNSKFEKYSEKELKEMLIANKLKTDFLK